MIDGQFTLGVEEEYQIVHPETRDLVSYVSKIVEDGHAVLRERVRPEMHQSMVEVGTGICKNVGEVATELIEMRKELDRLARQGGLRIVAASTHPFADWKLQDITDHHRYHHLVIDLQDVARANLIFLPHLLALSCSSPFWMKRKSGLMSTRSQIFKRFPRTGIPDEFESAAQFDELVKLLIQTGCIDNGKKLWWDVRSHHIFDTVEIRICDMPTSMEHTVAIVALVQALMAKLYLMYKRNTSWRTYRRALIEENKWRAVRYGSEAKLIDLGMKMERPFSELARELVEFVSETTEILGTTHYMKKIIEIADTGTSAHRQLEVFEQTGDLKNVVDWLMNETMRGI